MSGQRTAHQVTCAGPSGDDNAVGAQVGWGHAAASGAFDPGTARSINFLVSGPPDDKTGPVTADFWIDDLYFVE